MDEEDKDDKEYQQTYRLPESSKYSSSHLYKILCDQNNHIDYLKIKLASWKAGAIARKKEMNDLQETIYVLSHNCLHLQSLVNSLNAKLKTCETKPVDCDTVGKLEEPKKTYTVESKLNDPMIILADWKPEKGSKLNPRKI